MKHKSKKSYLVDGVLALLLKVLSPYSKKEFKVVRKPRGWKVII